MGLLVAADTDREKKKSVFLTEETKRNVCRQTGSGRQVQTESQVGGG